MCEHYVWMLTWQCVDVSLCTHTIFFYITNIYKVLGVVLFLFVQLMQIVLVEAVIG